MSRYLQLEIRGDAYLLDTAIVAEIRTFYDSPVLVRGEAVPMVDLGELFDGPKVAAGCCILVRREASGTIAVIVDRADSLVELADAEFRPLPPIGPLGFLIDAVSIRAGTTTPALRLRGERLWEYCDQPVTLSR